MSQPDSATDPEKVASLRRARLLAEDLATQLLAVAPAAPSAAQTVALDTVSYVMAALSAILGDLADIWEADPRIESR